MFFEYIVFLYEEIMVYIFLQHSGVCAPTFV